MRDFRHVCSPEETDLLYWVFRQYPSFLAGRLLECPPVFYTDLGSDSQVMLAEMVAAQPIEYPRYSLDAC
jgi:hypothetical protein